MDNLIKFNPFIVKPVSFMNSNIKYNYIDQPLVDQYLEMLENYYMFYAMYIHTIRVFNKQYCMMNYL
jgi:serine acetyltransferase